MIMVHAFTMIIIHACTMVIVHACSMIIIHACTMIILHACTMIVVHACTSTCMYYDHNTRIMSYRAHDPSPLRRGGLEGLPPPMTQEGLGGCKPPPQIAVPRYKVLKGITINTRHTRNKKAYMISTSQSKQCKIKNAEDYVYCILLLALQKHDVITLCRQQCN